MTTTAFLFNKDKEPPSAPSSVLSLHRWLDQEAETAPPTMAPTTVAENTVIVPWSVVWVTLVVSFVVGLLIYSIFACLYRKHGTQERLDVFEMRQGQYAHRSAVPFEGLQRGFFGWAKAAYQTSNTETLRCVGLDMYMFLRFLRLVLRCACCGTLIGCAMLIPVYGTANNNAEQFNQITLANVSQGDARLWAAAVGWTAFVLFVLRELYTEWKDSYATHRYEFLAHGNVDTDQEYRYAVSVESLPHHLRTNDALYQYLNRLFPNNAIHQVHVCLNTSALDALIQERQGLLEKWEAAVARQTVQPDKPLALVKDTSTSSGGGGGGCCGSSLPKVEAIPFYQKQVEKLNGEIDALRDTLFVQATASANKNYNKKQDNDMTVNKDGGNLVDDGIEVVNTATAEDEEPDKDEENQSSTNNKNKQDSSSHSSASSSFSLSKSTSVMSSTAFVTFTSLKAKQAAIQCNMGGKVDYMQVAPAPEPKGIVWPNVIAPATQQARWSFFSSLFWIVGLVFWAVPVTFVTGLANLNSLLETVGIEQLDPDTFYYGILAGILPVVFLQILMMVIYMGLTATAMYLIRKKSLPEVDAYTFYWYMLYQFANLWLILIGGSAFNQLDAMIKDPASIVTLMASAVPGASTFFLNMTILNSMVMSAFFLSNLAVWGQKLVFSYITPEEMKTQRMLDNDKNAQPLLWGQVLPPIVFIVLVGFVYMPIVPLMEPFVAIYFGAFYLVWKHNCLHVYANESEGGGLIWEKIFGFVMVCLYMAEFIVIAYLGIKEGIGPTIFSIIPLFATILVHMRLQRNIIGPLQTLSLEVAANVDEEDGTLSPMEMGALSFADAVERQLYGQPSLKCSQDERVPMPYRREQKEEGGGDGGDEEEAQAQEPEVATGVNV